MNTKKLKKAGVKFEALFNGVKKHRTYLILKGFEPNKEERKIIFSNLESVYSETKKILNDNGR